jgi:Membrane protein involved in the export of O-antigen and teichoic acid
MKVIKNYLYNLSNRILMIILPLITTPYVTRIFNSSDLGSYGYYNSIVSYFALAATLGIGNYAVKEISSNSKKRSKVFWEIYSIQLISSFTALGLYILLCFINNSLQNIISYILVISLLSRVIDISWLFQGVEDFRSLTYRSVTVKLIGVASIFLLIKDESDLNLYIFLIVFYELLGQVVMWIPAKKWLHKPEFSANAILKHLKPVLTLFIPQVAMSLYVLLDRTLLGALVSTRDVGVFEQADKIINLLLVAITTLGGAVLPHISNLISQGQKSKINQCYEFSFLLYNILIFPIIAGVLITNDDFVTFFLGKDFQEVRYAIAIMIFRMFFIGWTNIMGIQILIPHNKNREFMLSTTIPAFVSIICNLVLVPYFGYIGAAIVSVITEAIVWGIQLYYTRTYLKEVPILRNMFKIILASVMMYALLYMLKPVLIFTPALNVLVYAIIGGIIYLTIILSLKVINLAELRQQFVKK